MDSFKDSLANVSLYDVKAYVRKAQNAVLNFSEIESKVREATNNEPWGASTSLMQEIADATNSYQQFHEVMPFIYRRFTEKSASEWRQIYKALQLLEYLVKNGSERVVDYARSHTAVIDMLGHFHYVDKGGRDQGINIRNRAQELLALLGDVARIRSERKLARTLNNKTGISASNREQAGFGGTGKKYGGFSSSNIQFGGGGYSQEVYGDGGGFNGSNYNGTSFNGDRYDTDDFEEYNETGNGNEAPPAAPASGDDLVQFSSSAAANVEPEDDDFAEFQSAPAQATAGKANSILDLFGQPPASSSSAAPAFASAPTSASVAPPFAASSFNTSAAATPKPKKDDIFGSLWETSKKPAQSNFTAASASTQNRTQAPATSAVQPAPSASDDLLTF